MVSLLRRPPKGRKGRFPAPQFSPLLFHLTRDYILVRKPYPPPEKKMFFSGHTPMFTPYACFYLYVCPLYIFIILLTKILSFLSSFSIFLLYLPFYSSPFDLFPLLPGTGAYSTEHSEVNRGPKICFSSIILSMT
jgi:hypothetical protein